MIDRTYLGDGVYASHDGFQFWLETKRDIGVEKIALDPYVTESFCNFYNKIMNPHGVRMVIEMIPKKEEGASEGKEG